MGCSVIGAAIFEEECTYMVKSNNELLQYAISNGIINFEDVQKQVEMNKREYYLKKHPFSIWSAANGNWYTYLPDDSKPNKRAQKMRKSQDAIEKMVIEYWKEVERQEKSEKRQDKLTLETLFPKWLRYKALHTNSSATMKRISADWKKYYSNDPIIKIPLEDLTMIQLDEWVHGMIQQHELTKKQFYNMTIIVRQGLDYAVNLRVIETNTFQDVKVNTKMLRKTTKKPDETQVFLVDEEPLVIEEAYKDFNSNPTVTTPLAIPLAFQLGVRLGELVALKFSDIESDKYLHIQRMETRVYDTDDGISYHLVGQEVVEHTKSTAGDRKVFLSSDAKKLIALIKQVNLETGQYDNDYIFLLKGKRIHERSVVKRIEKYCAHLDISQTKGMHKIRKTFISKLIDSGLNINEIRKQVGHEDEKTTYRNYAFNRLGDKQTEDILEKTLIGNTDIEGMQAKIQYQLKASKFKVVSGNCKDTVQSINGQSKIEAV